MENKFEILKEEKINKHECPRCGRALYFCRNEYTEDKTFLEKLSSFWTGRRSTGNAWFDCERCNRTYLIKNYRKEGDKNV